MLSRKNRPLLAILLLLLSSGSSLAISPLQQCQLDELQRAGGNVTVEEIRSACQSSNDNPKTPVGAGVYDETNPASRHIAIQPQAEENIVDEALNARERAELKPFTLIAHRPNYFLFGVYNFKDYGEEPFQKQFDDHSLSWKNVETQFQISIKTPLAVNLFDKNIDIYAAYTNRSFWQLYSNTNSSPFRDTNHEPEAWLQWRPQKLQILGFKNSLNAFGIVHQSNGRGGTLSRSWNRVFANFVFSRNNLALSFKPWWRIPEDHSDDDNPDITDYMGHFQFGASYKYHEHTFTLMSRNNIESGFKKVATELSWSFPIPDYPYFKGYLQYYYGYGQSLIDYDRKVNSIGIGIALSDWL
ncbi:MAG: phospholipase A [gamma proteobacterium symbiont of Bathyaustriella thionipta]|nr:phospholipase A [gamma proteobacterium symbiont of Bathyaustriella thionipta]